MRLIDADSVKDFFFSETSGTEETIRDLAEKHNLTYLNNVNEDEVESFAKDLLKAVQNVIDTEPIAYNVDKVKSQMKELVEYPCGKGKECIHAYDNFYEEYGGCEKCVAFRADDIVKAGGICIEN